jgi:hypothetical protein
VAVYVAELGFGNSGPGGPLPAEPPFIVSIEDLTVSVVTLRLGRHLVEHRVEIIPKRGGLPLLSLIPDEIPALRFMLSQRAQEARRR